MSNCIVYFNLAASTQFNKKQCVCVYVASGGFNTFYKTLDLTSQKLEAFLILQEFILLAIYYKYKMLSSSYGRFFNACAINTL